MSYETVIQQIDLTHNGKTYSFQICAEPGQPQRAFIGATTGYYDIPAFNAALEKADRFVIRQVADLFECDASDVMIPAGFICTSTSGRAAEGLAYERRA